MYTPPMFKPDRAASLAFAEARGFGTVCAWDGKQADRLAAAVLSDYADDGTPRGAVSCRARQSAGQAGRRRVAWLLAVNGADAYVSPDWYVSPDQVPTWLYQAVHLTGPVRTLSATTNSSCRSIR